MSSFASVPGSPISAEPSPSHQASSFLKALLDTSFTTFIVHRLVRFLYIFFMVVGVLAAVGVIVSAFGVNSGLGVLALLLSPVVFLLVLIQARVTLELIAIVFRIEENTARMSHRS